MAREGVALETGLPVPTDSLDAHILEPPLDVGDLLIELLIQPIKMALFGPKIGMAHTAGSHSVDETDHPAYAAGRPALAPPRREQSGGGVTCDAGVVTTLPAIAIYGFGAGAIGTLGGLGGAVLLVPLLVLVGVDPTAAAPVGLLTVIAASLAASPTQIDAGLVHHRIGIVTETAASAGAMLGAMLAGLTSPDALRLVMAAVALIGAVLVLRPRPVTEPTTAAFAAESPGEWPGTLAGAAPMDGIGDVVPYAAQRTATGTALMAGAGVVAGLSGVSGGYLKTPVLVSVMRIPTRVAAATTTFTVGVTAASALLVFLARGHVDVDMAAAAVAGAVPGGRAGAALQMWVPERVVRVVLSAALAVIASLVVATG